MPFNFLNLFRLVFSILYFQFYAVMQTSTRFPFLAVQRNISFNPMQLCELRLTTQTTSVNAQQFQSCVAAWTTLCQKVSKASDAHSFNLMQSTRPPCFYWTTTYPPPWLHQRFTFFFNSNPLVYVRIVFQNVLGNHFPVLDVL